MAKKECVICGKEGYMYFPFCYEHLQQKNEGLIVKCEDCGEWFFEEDGCSCQDDENFCEICGEESGQYNFCRDCFNEGKGKTILQCKDCKEWYLKKKGCRCNQPQEQTIIKHYEYLNKTAKETKVESTDIRKQWDAPHRCNDGHYVRSYSEMLIDNWLYDNGFVHAYEKKVFLLKNPEEKLLSDFYIPEGKIYIEFFGLDNVKYKARKEEKIRLYNNNNLNLICLEQEHIKILDDIMMPELYKFINKTNEKDKNK